MPCNSFLNNSASIRVCMYVCKREYLYSIVMYLPKGAFVLCFDLDGVSEHVRRKSGAYDARSN